jgi:hemerythrin-like domain-containing protein
VLRDKSLIPLSHQHQHALALCVRIDRAVQAGNADVRAFEAEIWQIFEQEIQFHFQAEETVIFPAAERFRALQSLVIELMAEHAALRGFFERARKHEFDASMLQKFVDLLSNHIRKEERQLFEQIQQLMSPEEISTIGIALDKALKPAQEACFLPNESTRLRPRTPK